MPVALVCQGCRKCPEEIEEYVDMAREEGYGSASEFVRAEEGTLNHETGHFLCTACYIAAGMPSSPMGWVCT